MASTADEPICRGLAEAIALSAYFAPIGDLLWPLHRYPDSCKCVRTLTHCVEVSRH